MRPVLFLLLLTTLTGCGEPRIEDNTDAPWFAGDAREFRMTIARPFLTSVDAVRLRYTRHRWPGFGAANVSPVTAEGEGTEPTDDGIGAVPAFVRATPDDPSLAKAPDSHHVFYQWEVDFTRPFGLGSGTRRSPVLDFTIGCTPEMLEEQLLAAQEAIFATHDIPNPHQNPPLGYSYRPHNFVSIESTGVGFASALAGAIGPGGIGSLGMPDSIELESPAILGYRPRPQRPGEDDDAYFAEITDPFGPDPDYEIAGAFYGTLYSPDIRPVMGCIPSSAWFVHEAGFHMIDGSMTLFEVEEDVAGETPVSAILPPPEVQTPDNVLFWHGRTWDLHIWFVGEDEPPVIQILSPEPIPGIPVEGLFFEAETFE